MGSSGDSTEIRPDLAMAYTPISKHESEESGVVSIEGV
jgi:hypothetical protein